MEKGLQNDGNDSQAHKQECENVERSLLPGKDGKVVSWQHVV
jgi:hypothetical protein